MLTQCQGDKHFRGSGLPAAGDRGWPCACYSVVRCRSAHRSDLHCQHNSGCHWPPVMLSHDRLSPYATKTAKRAKPPKCLKPVALRANQHNRNGQRDSNRRKELRATSPHKSRTQR